jgi:hypothetical protein
MYKPLHVIYNRLVEDIVSWLELVWVEVLLQVGEDSVGMRIINPNIKLIQTNEGRRRKQKI